VLIRYYFDYESAQIWRSEVLETSRHAPSARQPCQVFDGTTGAESVPRRVTPAQAEAGANAYAAVHSCLVGPTGKGRKGTAYDYIDYQMRTVDTSWTTNNISGGCGSGEGLITAVKDKTIQREPIRERKRVVGYQEVEIDPGVLDKRLLVHESEFASVLKIASREGNILSIILR
jgi:hypothetical protein